MRADASAKSNWLALPLADVRQSRVFQGGLEGDAEAGAASGIAAVRGKETQ